MVKKADLFYLRRIGLIYGILIAIINFIGYLVASSSSIPIKENEDYSIWINYLENNKMIPVLFMILAFLIPTVCCASYVIFCSEDSAKKRIINLPIVYSLYGSLGWFISLISETVVLLVLKYSEGLNIKTIIGVSSFNMFQICTFITTFGFFILDLINRKMILPKLFPDGKLSQYPGVINLSSEILFTIFFFSVSIFPISFLTSVMYNLSLSYGFNIETGVILVLILILIIGIVMTVFFSDHFSSPLKKLKKATEEVTNSNYNVRVDVVSSDDFGMLADNYNEMAFTIDNKSKKILSIQDSIVRGMAVMVEQRDNSTGGHINRTSDCVRIFMEYLKDNSNYNFTEEFATSMIKAAPMHDLGKISIDDRILRKAARFTDEEYEIMKGHASAGQYIVDSVLCEVEDPEFKRIARNVAHYHHEKWDGTGYPEKIAGESIPVEARIMALADVFDALVSKRCYKDAMSYDTAFEIIKKDLGTHFDPELGILFLECKDKLEALYEAYKAAGNA